MKAVAVLLIFALVSPAVAQDHAGVLKDQPAPFSGVVVSEQKFTEYLTLELKVEELEGRLEIQENLVQNVEQVYSKKLETATRPERWYEGAGFNLVLGFLIGFGVTVGIFYGGAELAKAVR